MTRDRLVFDVTFHGPVRVGTGRARSGIDDTVDGDLVVPGSSLKGLMKAEAAILFGGPKAACVEKVFGTPRGPSPWHWSDITRAADDPVHVGARIRVDDETGTTVDGALFLGEYHWPDVAVFEVTRFAAVAPVDLPEHRAVLVAAAAAVRSIGGDRNRGFGWVDVRPHGGLSDDVATHIERLMTR